ncbi:hypothetical protein GJ654_00205 [Rhodoblastus acidophilus]|uniref:6-phosphogluconate dehydrogenase NADP-binding domain-containing protein n=1 Tax=Rhodoblastus acidophilus TaxID=1074 RepID=A0A6N8DI54_RHOAC|nr:NAD(P)-binding domain-containing protein [Rhodoblastus acidophilus]MCW2272489.1 3-hydroxyisobutyrate dehydrogenase-like beta-hydroxyacid dehydrogenase [Rhodoblastus acidophilus]MTV29406.1 hypothetical protein [Rhodoblastus acidophilus]
MTIGFIGLGDRGGAIVGHPGAAGHEVTVWNRSADKAAPPAEAAASDTVGGSTIAKIVSENSGVDR